MTNVLTAGVYSTATAAEYLGIAKNYLHNMRHHGKGPACNKEGGRIYYNREALDAWNAERIQRSEARAAKARSNAERRAAKTRSTSASRAAKGPRGERKPGRKAGYGGAATA